MTTIVSFLFVLGVLVFVHELGHFLAARRVGVRVLTFSLGFGPKLLKVVRGDTEYCISLIPLGGYVKMAGEQPDETRVGEPDEFPSKTKWQRFQIMIMGPVMNFALALLVMAFVLSRGAQVPVYLDQPPVVGGIAAGSSADRVGLRPGDRIVSVAGRAIKTWQDLHFAIETRPNQEIAINLTRDERPLAVTVRSTSEGRFEVGDIGVLPNTHPVIESFVPGNYPAKDAGFKVNDMVVAINGAAVFLRSEFIDIVSKSEGRPLDFTVRRGQEESHLTVTPIKSGAQWMIGARLTEESKLFMPGPLEAVSLSFDWMWKTSDAFLRVIGGLFTGTTSVKQFQGPVGIAQLSGESAQAGWIPLLAFMAMISLNLGLINLMPVPMLDGGHIVIMALEGIARRDFSAKVKENFQVAGLVVVLMLMVTAFYNDLARISWIAGLMPWRN